MRERQLTTTDLVSISIIDHRPIFRLGMELAIKGFKMSTPRINITSYDDSEDLNQLELADIYFLCISTISDSEVLIRIKIIRSKFKYAKIVLYGFRKLASSLLPFFEENINGYLPENFVADDLHKSILSLINNKIYIDSSLLHELLVAKISDKVVKSSLFSSMENEVAGYLLKGMSTSVIAKTMDRKMSTISTVKSNIFKKAKVDNIIDLSRLISL